MLYAVAIGLSALLLFAIEPMTVKHLLPWFGGSSEVWATSLLFFTTMLFVGYGYVYLLSKRPIRQQPIIHFYMIAIAVCATFFSLIQWHTIYPPLDWTIGNTASPAINVLKALLFAIGAPFFFLSTTGPLLQYWYGISTRKEPYILYALSNAGSLAALLGYIFIAEPHSTLTTQATIWSVLFLVCVAINVFILVRIYKNAGKLSAKSLLTHDKAEVSSPVSTRMYAAWIWYGALPAFMLVATTVEITQSIAPVPLLWIAPLMIYLLTFIFAFAGWGRSILVPFLLLAITAYAYTFAIASPLRILPEILTYLTFLFFCGLCCSARLYHLRPSTKGLPLFYLAMSFGGMIGTLFASILAPLVFTDFWEFPLGVALSAGVAVYLLSDSFFPRMFDARRILLVKVLLVAGIVYLFVGLMVKEDSYTSVRSRNFYGAVRIEFGTGWTSLMHGTTLHGVQLSGPDQEYLPTTYYAPTSGVGRAVFYERAVRKGKDVRVGNIGLGVGTMAAYCRKGDSFVFYEIDPQIVALAHDYFSYLSHCAGAQVRLGDGRMLLEAERRAGDLGEYDLLTVDAFSDDTIPVHLLTIQSLTLYMAHLRSPDSMIAFDVSNRYLDLAPVVLRLAAQLGMSATVVVDDGNSIVGGTSSSWIVLTKDPAAFRTTTFANINNSIPKASPTVWTDDYTSIVAVFHPGAIF